MLFAQANVGPWLCVIGLIELVSCRDQLPQHRLPDGGVRVLQVDVLSRIFENIKKAARRTVCVDSIIGAVWKDGAEPNTCSSE